MALYFTVLLAMALSGSTYLGWAIGRKVKAEPWLEREQDAE